VQVIKGWVDGAGETHERVFDVLGDVNNRAAVYARLLKRSARRKYGPLPIDKFRDCFADTRFVQNRCVAYLWNF